jgi:hypothetical protein
MRSALLLVPVAFASADSVHAPARPQPSRMMLVLHRPGRVRNGDVGRRCQVPMPGGVPGVRHRVDSHALRGPGLGRSERTADPLRIHLRMRSIGGWKNAVKVVMAQSSRSWCPRSPTSMLSRSASEVKSRRSRICRGTRTEHESRAQPRGRALLQAGSRVGAPPDQRIGRAQRPHVSGGGQRRPSAPGPGCGHEQLPGLAPPDVVSLLDLIRAEPEERPRSGAGQARRGPASAVW